MKDLHTHILYDIDDGSNSLEESLEILKQASLNGVTDIVLTPHYVKGSKYSADNAQKKKLFNELKKWVDISSININIYLGNEVYITEDSLSLSKEISTINNSRYILIELPLNTKYNLIFESLNKLKKKNLIPIIAHPERYMAYYEDYDFFDNLRKIGCLLQGNIGSIYGNYGKKSKKMIIYMLENNMLDFLASDIHHANNIIYDKDIKRDIFKIVKDKEVVEKLLNTNAEKVLNDIDIVEWSKNNEE